jgi:hypothetical protein
VQHHVLLVLLLEHHLLHSCTAVCSALVRAASCSSASSSSSSRHRDATAIGQVLQRYCRLLLLLRLPVPERLLLLLPRSALSCALLRLRRLTCLSLWQRALHSSSVSCMQVVTSSLHLHTVTICTEHDDDYVHRVSYTADTLYTNGSLPARASVLAAVVS